MASPAAAGNDRLMALLAMDRMPLSSAGRPAQSRAERWMRYLGFPGGIAAFLLIYYAPPGDGLSAAAQAGLASFALALVWWVTEPFPTYVTSLALMFLLLTTRVAGPKPIMDVLGLEVIWLNLLAFILASMLVKTRLARRLALALVVRFGSTAKWALFAFLVLQLVLAPLIPATAARTVMTLPLMLVIAAIFGSTEDHPTAFGKNLMLLNLIGISVLSSMSMTGSSANLMAVGFIESMGGHRVYYMDWMRLGAPVAIATTVFMWFAGRKWLFPLAPAEQVPQLPGGLAAIRETHAALGPLTTAEKKAIAIFALVLFLWTTDVFHLRWFGLEITAPFAALLGVVIALFPRWGVLQWAEAEIPWHLLIFSAGAYAGGLALDDTGAAEWLVRLLFGRFELQRLSFGAAYTLIVGVMMYSHLLTTSKTVRTMIMIPIVITLTRGLGWDPVSFALPAALTIDWVIGLPISGKPNVILFATNQYSVIDNFKYGVTACTVGLLILVGSAATWFHWLGVTPSFFATAPSAVAIAPAARADGVTVRLDVRDDGSAIARIADQGQSTTETVGHVLSAPGPAGRSLSFSYTHMGAAAIPEYTLDVVLPDGLRALAIREALPKARPGEITPRASLVTTAGRAGVRLRAANVKPGDRVSLQVDLIRASRPWGWSLAGFAVGLLYLVSFRDLVKGRTA